MKLVILEVIQFLLVAESDAVGYEFRDPRLAHDDCGVINTLSRAVRRRIDHYGFHPFVTGCTFDLQPPT